MSDETQLAAELYTHHEQHTSIDQETKVNDEMIYVNDNPAENPDIENKSNLRKEIYVNNPYQQLIGAQKKLIRDLRARTKKTENSRYIKLTKLFIIYIFGCMDKDIFETATFKINPSASLYIHRASIRVIHVWISALLIVAFGHADKLGIPRIVTFIFFVITAIIPVSIYSYFYFAKKRGRSNENLSIREFMNTTFGIPHPSREIEKEVHNLFDFDRDKWGLQYSMFVLLCSINNIFIFGPFYLTPEELDECADESIGNVFAGKCAVNQSGLSQIYVIVWAYIVTFPSYYRLNRLYVRRMGDYLNKNIQDKDLMSTGWEDSKYYKDRIWEKGILTRKISDLKKEIQDTLVIEWKDSKYFKNRIWEALLTYLVFLSFHVIVYGIIRNDIFELDMIYIIFCLYLYITESIMIATIAFTVIKLLYHYQFPTFIMNEIGKQFDADNIDDIISWWELRKFYLECIIEVYGKGIQGWVGSGLIGFAICAAFGFLWSRSDAPDSSIIKWVFYGFAILVMIFAFSLTAQAVNVYNAQLSHVFTLKRERLRLKCKGKNEDMDIFDEILDDVTENTKPMRVFGLKMVPEFMIILQTTAITVAIAAAFS